MYGGCRAYSMHLVMPHNFIYIVAELLSPEPVWQGEVSYRVSQKKSTLLKFWVHVKSMWRLRANQTNKLVWNQGPQREVWKITSHKIWRLMSKIHQNNLPRKKNPPLFSKGWIKITKKQPSHSPLEGVIKRLMLRCEVFMTKYINWTHIVCTNTH